MKAEMDKNRRSSEAFELSEMFANLAEQTAEENRPRSIPELINFLVSHLHLNELCGRKLQVFDLTPDYMNGIIDFGGAGQMVRICEALKEAAISSIAEEIALRSSVRVVLIAGPSSSGKTTFCKKLTYALEQQGLHPVGISLDDYYNDSSQAPLDEEGKPDWESIYALNLSLLQEQVATLTRGGEVALPRYDFTKGQGCITDRRLRLQPDSILLLEGIHALNPILLDGVQAAPDRFFRIYLSALTTRHLPNGDIYPTTDNRLVRRIVRDAQFRNASAQQTLSRWGSVRRGEEQWIVPFQPQADVNFNSAYQYEYGLLREHAQPLLNQVSPDSPQYAEAQRLLDVLRLYHAMPVHHLPPYSLLREFLGGSGYEY